MKKFRLALVAAMVAAGAAQAQDVKVNALFIAWYTQMMDNSLRLNGIPTGQTLSYYSLGGTKGTSAFSPYNENGFSVRRAEIYVSAKITDEISGNLMLDPNQPAPLLFDAFLTWKPVSMFEIRVGQFKPIGYEASLVAAPDLLFTDRGQVVRYGTDYRDRGLLATVGFGDKVFSGRVGLGVFNGSTDRQNENNAQKDFVLRADFKIGTDHMLGAYGQQGSTNLADKTGSGVAAGTFTGTGPNAAEVFDAKDKTSNYGAYYVFNHGPFHVDAEATTGLLGRRNASLLPAAGAAKRQHLDQKFLGYYLTGAYTLGQHMVRARYDFMNYNQGDKWYTAYNPYKESAPGVARTDGGDYSPKYREITVGYTFAFKADSFRKANVKFDYIFRSKNFLAPLVGQVGEQGGDSLVGAFQVYF